MGTFTPRDLAKWSWSEALQGARAGRVTGVHAEADRELRRQFFSGAMDTTNRQIGSPHSFLVPNEVWQRDATVAGTGGYLVAVDNVGFLDVLAPQLVVAKLGATRLTGLVGNTTVPKMVSGATAYWLASEGAPGITESNAVFSQAALAPKTVGAYSEFSRQLMLQSSPSVNKVIARELSRRVAVAIDAAAINGAGGAEPLGILNVPTGLGAFTGGSLDLAALVNAQSDLATSYIDSTQASYCTTPAVAALLSARQKFTGSDRALWEGPLSDGSVAGLRAIASTQMPTATMILGDWQYLYLGEWGSPVEVAVNPYADFASGIVGVRALAMVDVVCAYPGAFSVATSIT